MSRHHTDPHQHAQQNRVIEDVLRALDKITQHYDPALTGPAAADENRGIGARRQGEPGRIECIEARAEAMRDLVSWVNLILMEVNDGTITHGPAQVDITGLCTFIRRWTPAIVEQLPDDADNLHREMWQHADRLEALARGWTTKRYAIGRCPEQTLTITPEGIEELTPCTGTLHATIRAQDTDLPKAVECDASHEHHWEPWRWRDLGRRLGTISA